MAKKKNNTNLYIGIAVVVVIALIFLSSKQAPEPAPVEQPVEEPAPAPEPEPAPEPTNQVEEAKEPVKTVESRIERDDIEERFTDLDRGFLSNIKCDYEGLKMTFTLTNRDENVKYLGRVPQYGDAAMAMKVSINGKHLRELPTICGEGDQNELAVGESVTCTKVFGDQESLNQYGIKRGSTYEGFTTNERVNRMSARTLEMTDEKYFGC